MQLPHLTPRRKGFTLVEILVVIAILAALSASMWTASGYIKDKELKNTANTQVQQMEAALNAYRTDSGGTLPFGKGDEYSSHVLYKALFCDEDNDGEPDEVDGKFLMPYCNSLVVIKNKKEKEQEEGIPVMRAKISTKAEGKRVNGKFFLIMDPWGNPYRYRLGYDTEDARGKTGPGINPDFDIFSLGGDGLGDGKTNDGDNEDNITNIRSWK